MQCYCIASTKDTALIHERRHSVNESDIPVFQIKKINEKGCRKVNPTSSFSQLFAKLSACLFETSYYHLLRGYRFHVFLRKTMVLVCQIMTKPNIKSSWDWWSDGCRVWARLQRASAASDQWTCACSNTSQTRTCSGSRKGFCASLLPPSCGLTDNAGLMDCSITVWWQELGKRAERRRHLCAKLLLQHERLPPSLLTKTLHITGCGRVSTTLRTTRDWQPNEWSNQTPLWLQCSSLGWPLQGCCHILLSAVLQNRADICLNKKLAWEVGYMCRSCRTQGIKYVEEKWRSIGSDQPLWK